MILSMGEENEGQDKVKRMARFLLTKTANALQPVEVCSMQSELLPDLVQQLGTAVLPHTKLFTRVFAYNILYQSSLKIHFTYLTL